jgi:uncharacterized protein (TIGR02996 family)
MSAADRAAFLAAIRDNPEDDLPRLIYADWLEEHGEPERAEFIRVQCELARLSNGDPRGLRLIERQDELWSAHQQSWRSCPGWGVIVGTPERGFVRYVGASNFTAFAAVAEQLFADHPVQQVAISRMRPKHLRTLAQMPLLTIVTHLDVSGGTISNSAVVAFARSPYLGRLRELNLSRNQIGDIGAQVLAELSALVGLRVLALSDNAIGDTGAESLAAAPHWHDMKCLELGNNPIGPDGRALLRARYCDTVKLGPLDTRWSEP